jgi:glutamine amidotransferase
MIAIIDYNMGNLASVYNACKLLDTKAIIVSDPNELKNYSKIILPGVGAYGDAMAHLERSGMKEAVLEYAKSGNPMIGICLGMQLLFESSQEFGSHKGLGLIEGEVVKFDSSKFDDINLKIPHMGWNKIITKSNKLFDGVNSIKDPYLYFVHSFHIQTDEKNIIGTTGYGYEFASAVNKDNIYGLQPHPEKSHEIGIKILENFINL